MTNLIQKLEEEKQAERLARAQEEENRINSINASFSGINKDAIAQLVSSVETGLLMPGENMLVRYCEGEYATGKTRIARGKIINIDYGEKGKIILKTRLFGRKVIPFNTLVGTEHRPEIREAREKADAELREKIKLKEDYLFEMVNGWGSPLTLKYGDSLEMNIARKIIRQLCKNEGWEYVNANGRGPMTGKGYGDLQCTGALNSKGDLIGGIGIYSEMFDCATRTPTFVSSFKRQRVQPTLSSIVKIENPELRGFIAGIYTGLYGDVIGRTQ